MKNLKALGIGEIVLDKTCLLPLYPEEGIKIKPSEVHHSLGGPVVAALILLSKLGIDTTLIASVGKDKHGEEIQKKLEQTGTKFIPKIQKITKVNTVLVNALNASRTIIKDTITYSPIKHVDRKLIESADIIFFDRHEPKAMQLVMKVKKNHTRVVLDPSTEMSDKTMEMFQYVDHVIVPIESFHSLLSAENLPTKLRFFFYKFGKPIILTAGENGSILYDGNNMELFAAYHVKAVDTLGAGDVFRGAFGYGLLKNMPLRECIKFANKVAALQCTKVGNGTAIPSWTDIEKFSKVAVTKQVTLNEVSRIIH